MIVRTRPLTGGLLAALIAALLLAVPSAPPANAGDFPARVAGDTSIDTAVALSAFGYEAADTVVVARSDDYADALAVGPLAASLDAPLLFVDTDDTPQAVLDEIVRLGATRVIIAGGPVAVSEAAEAEIAALEGVTVERLAGSNRFLTAIQIAGALVGEQTPEIVFFVEGENADDARGWPDAISASALASAIGAPILPVNAERVPDSILDAWLGWADAPGIIVGGEVAVTAEVEEILAAAVPPAEEMTLAGDDAPMRDLTRVAGDTRFTTSDAIFNLGVSTYEMDPSTTVIIPGGSFNEGLAAGAWAGANNHPILMLDNNGDSNVAGLETLRGASDLILTLVGVGSADLLSDDVLGAAAATQDPSTTEAAFCLTLLHNNDAESNLLGIEDFEAYGGLARFVTLAQQEQAAGGAFSDGCEDGGVVTVTSGDNFLPGPILSASLADDDGPFYDVLGYDRVGYDALAIGNHEFDLGPDVLERFIAAFSDPAPPFLTANLTFEDEPGLQALVDEGRIAASTVITRGETDIAIIGATTPTIDSISSPRNTTIIEDVAGAITAEVEATADADIHILISHLQGINEDQDLLAMLTGIDVVVAGGGDEILANPGNPLMPEDVGSVFGPYPLAGVDADGSYVPVVTTAGDLKYLGRLNLYFDADGNLLADTPVDARTSRMVRVADESLPGGVIADPETVADLEPVQDFVDSLSEVVLATSEVDLDGSRPAIRNSETNLGNLMADSLLYTAAQLAEDFGLDTDQPFVSLQNGGGIRASAAAGDFTLNDTFNIARFFNLVGAIPDVTPAQLKTILERGYASVEFASGNFAHIGDMMVEVDISQQGQEIDEDDTIVTEGERVISVTLADGTPVITDGEVDPAAPEAITLVTIDFLARGGDSYPLGDLPFSNLGVSYQQALENYVVDGLGGVISSADYPEGGEGRITIIGAAE